MGELLVSMRFAYTSGLSLLRWFRMACCSIMATFSLRNLTCSAYSLIKKNDIFFAMEGSKQSGNLYSSEALSKGAYKVVTSKNIKNKNYLIVKNVNKFLAEACSAKYKEKPKNIFEMPIKAFY